MSVYQYVSMEGPPSQKCKKMQQLPYPPGYLCWLMGWVDSCGLLDRLLCEIGLH